MQDKNIDKAWFDVKYNKWPPEKLNIDLVVVANRNKEIFNEHGLNGNRDIILNNHRISKLFEEDKYTDNISFGGFKEYNGEIYLLGVCPIFKTTTEGTSQGVVIIGKKILPSFLKTLQDQFGNNIFITYNDKFISTESMTNKIAKNSLLLKKNKNNSVYVFDNSKTIGSAPLVDICDNPIGQINVIYSRHIFSSTQELMQKNNLLIMLISSILLLILDFKSKSIIVDPINNLENQITNMEHNNPLELL